jgi:hypothetical protein
MSASARKRTSGFAAISAASVVTVAIQSPPELLGTPATISLALSLITAAIGIAHHINNRR